jgi:hypothetical protein
LDVLPPSTYPSRPTYQALQPVPGPGRHWLVLQAGQVSESVQIELVQAFAPVQSRLQIGWVGASQAAPAQEASLPGLVPVGPVLALADLAALKQALAQQTVLVSDRLYVQGTEPFVWAVAQAAHGAGWTHEQVQLCHAGSLQRRVWCTHCHGYTEGVTTSIVACAGCGRSLLVRDHFSKRHGAFMGVMVDAEVPGVVPQAEEIFP